jgi:hypothetical protein
MQVFSTALLAFMKHLRMNLEKLPEHLRIAGNPKLVDVLQVLNTSDAERVLFEFWLFAFGFRVLDLKVS